MEVAQEYGDGFATIRRDFEFMGVGSEYKTIRKKVYETPCVLYWMNIPEIPEDNLSEQYKIKMKIEELKEQLANLKGEK